MKLSEIMNGTQCEKLSFEAEITDVTDKPEKIGKNCAYVCIEGAKYDGHNNAARAIAGGCSAIICEKDTGTPLQVRVKNSRLALSQMLAALYKADTDRIKLVGITGTNGKTSTAFFLRHILQSASKKTGLIGTLGVAYDSIKCTTNMTTPEPGVLFPTIANMAKSGCEYCVSEVSSQALAQNRCASLEFEVAVFTNLGRDHFDYHKSSENYAQAKRRLFEQSRQAVLNADDPVSEYMAAGCAGKKLFYSASNSNADFYAENICYETDRTSYVLCADSKKYKVIVPAIGIFSVYNSLAAISAAYLCGIPLEQSCEYMYNAIVAPGRAERAKSSAPFSVYVDYAHTPDALEGILKTFGVMTRGRIITLFGCGGDRDKEKRPLMGSVAAKYSDMIIITDDNPRTENPESIVQDIKRGISTSEVIIERDRRRAIEIAIENAKPNDIVLIAGKGHEDYQIIGSERLHFSDIETVTDILSNNYGY